jgi:hypothetical protein
MSQSRTQSIIETATNILVGYWINFAANLIVLPLFGFHISVRDNLGIGLIYTVISIVRGYVLRRTFNRWHAR